MRILPIPGRELYNATLRNYIIEAKFQNKFIKKFAPENVKVAKLMDYSRLTTSLKEYQAFG